MSEDVVGIDSATYELLEARQTNLELLEEVNKLPEDERLLAISVAAEIRQLANTPEIGMLALALVGSEAQLKVIEEEINSGQS